jgi:hypothetical protein
VGAAGPPRAANAHWPGVPNEERRTKNEGRRTKSEERRKELKN